jgi:methylmalonyl-CoA/ethylmalonyl-CoA epimerase
MRVDHVAIAVNSVAEALKNYEKILKIDKVDIEDVPTERVKVAYFEIARYSNRIDGALLQMTVQ